MNREEAKNKICDSWRELITDLTDTAQTKVNGKVSYICPICGHGAHGDGLTNNPKSEKNGLKCFGCGFSGDIIDLYQKQTGKDYPETLQDLASRLSITIDAGTDTATTSTATKAPEKKQTADYSGYFKQAQENRKEKAAQDYLKRRGISEKTAAAFGLGYDAAVKTFTVTESGEKKPDTWRAVVLPTGNNSYIIRNIDQKEPNAKNRYRKKGNSGLFNTKSLYESETPVFVVEGEFDALSIIEAGGQAVALGSTANKNQLVNLAKSQRPAQPLILALDADEQGQKAQDELKAELTALNIECYTYDIYNGAKDANAALTADRGGFVDAIARAENAREEELKAIREAQRAEYLKSTAGASIDELHDYIKKSANIPAIDTGFNGLNTILDGGLYPGLYVLGAISSLGKTTLVLQIADQIAQRGQDILIFSLEMSKLELMAKSISRTTFLQADEKRNAKTMRGILSGSRYAKYNQQERETINAATDSYKEYADHIFIFEGVGDIGVKEIAERVKHHIDITGRKPIVIIDYLQILAPYTVGATDKQNTDKAILELKRLSRDDDLTIIGISSFNRDSYKGSSGKGRVNMADFKESGAIEYSADVLIGLEFAGAGDSDYSEREEKKKNPREVRLVILKNRNGKAWESTNFYYYPAFNYYEEEEAQVFDWEDEINDNPFTKPKAEKKAKRI